MKPLKGHSFQIRREDEPTPRSMKVPISIRRVSTTPPESQEWLQKQTQEIYYSLSDIHPSIEHEEDIPDVVEASYTNDYNLFHIHDIIIRKLRAERRDIVPLEERLSVELGLVKQPQTILERRTSLEKIKKIQGELDQIQFGERMKAYMERAEPLIREYEILVPKHKHIDFTASTKEKLEALEEEEKDPKYWKKMRIVRKYLDIAKKYIELRIIQKRKNFNVCACGHDLTEVFIDNFGTQVCPECGNDRYIIGYNLCKRDTLSSRNDYSDRDNFEKALMRYQGKQIDKIPETLFGDLDKYFRVRGKPTSATVKSLPYSTRGRKKGTDLSMLYKALNETGYSSLYEDANLIAHKYWGWQLQDVSYLEAVIMGDYEKTQRVYNMLHKERSSSLGTQFRLFKHLQLRGHPCTVDDFKIVKMRESLEYHDEVWRIMCERCGDPEIYFIPTI